MEMRAGAPVLPLGLLAAAVLAGIAAQLQLPAPLEASLRRMLLGAALALLPAGLVLARRGRRTAAAWVLLPACALLAALQADVRAAQRLSHRLDPALSDRLVQVEGVVAGLPQMEAGRWRGLLEVERAGWPATLTAAGSRVNGDAPPPLPPRLRVVWPASAAEPVPARAQAPRAGQRWRLTLRLRPPGGRVNPQGPDAVLAAFEDDAGGTGVVAPRAAVPADLAVPLGESGRHRIDRWRQDQRDRIVARLGARPGAGLIAALAVGDQGAIEQDDWALFRRAGLAHLVAISGLHVTMFAWLAGVLAGALWRRLPGAPLRCPAPRAARRAGVLAALGYALLSGWGVPSQRTVLMLALVVLLREGARQWPAPRLLGVVAAVVALADPWALLQPGFWLSFVAVALLFGSAPTQAAGGGAPGGGGRRPWRDRWFDRWRGRCRDGAREALRSQWVATVGLAPWTLVFFSQIPLVGLPANALAIPVVTLVLTPLALLGLLLEPLWWPALQGAEALRAAVAPLAAWPGAVWSAPAAPDWARALGIVAAAALVLPAPVRLRLLALPALLPMLWPALPRPQPGEFELLAADVGQGHAVLIRTARHVLLHDTGPAYGRHGEGGDAGERVLVPLLRAQGIDAIDRLVLSHRDTDHVGGAASLLQALPVRLMHSSLEPGHPLRARTPHQPCRDGLRWEHDGVRFEFLHPQAEVLERTGPGRASSNALSCVLRIESARGRRVLLTGDIGVEQELALGLRHPEALRAEVLQVPHHGSASSSGLYFVNSVTPTWAIVQSGRFNPYGHPAWPVLQRYRDLGTHLILTTRCGAWHWSSADASSWCARAERWRYWQDGEDRNPGTDGDPGWP
ncbi:DNA internalization-related competence protein ComEC/Rec2 [Sphaerotilus uruguayifluvii]|uniref:Competence protein ComEC n=1 Tax=Sphaerotilus uruguayifluvii TaxID=2735897 RepID=A0ABX2G1M2_9BURK|nr:DNA internalization-related competence protein ComEC/Rec2 [Leptothrix sp. C29]NRT56188.1 competence protein ComEC [Leptothrix sp. C29]